MLWRPAARLSIVLLVPLAAGGCNAVFGISGGTPSTGGGGTGGSSADGGGTGGSGVCLPARMPACDADGGLCAAQLLDSEGDADDLAIGGDFLFFTTGDGETVHRLRYDGTAGSDIGGGSAATRLAIEGSHVYWTDYYGGGNVKSANLDGSGVITIAVMAMSQQIGNGRIAAHDDPTGTLVYWTTYSPPAIWRTLPDGAHQTPTLVLTQNPAQHVDAPTGVAVDALYLYWGDTDGVRRLLVADVGAANPPIEDFAIDDTAPVETVVLDTDRVYWLTSSGDVRSKAKTDPASGPPVIYVGGSADTPLGIALDDTSVYWITLSGAVWKADKGGGAPVAVTAGPPLQIDSAGGLAVDCGAVYWAVPAMTAQDKGRVFRAAKGP